MNYCKLKHGPDERMWDLVQRSHLSDSKWRVSIIVAFSLFSSEFDVWISLAQFFFPLVRNYCRAPVSQTTQCQNRHYTQRTDKQTMKITVVKKICSNVKFGPDWHTNRAIINQSINQSINGICKAPLTKLDSGAGQKQWLKCHWTQGNAVPAPPVIEIQRSHTSNFIKRVHSHMLGAHFGPKLIYSSLTSDFPL